MNSTSWTTVGYLLRNEHLPDVYKLTGDKNSVWVIASSDRSVGADMVSLGPQGVRYRNQALS